MVTGSIQSESSRKDFTGAYATRTPGTLQGNIRKDVAPELVDIALERTARKIRGCKSIDIYLRTFSNSKLTHYIGA